IPFDSVDLAKIVNRVVDKLSYLAANKRLKLRIQIRRERAVWGNASALEQITMNIVKNALQHTRTGEIVIGVEPTNEGMMELYVRDTGSGIKRDDLTRIFEPFYRGDRARTRNGGTGSGLGLAIVSELVRLHHGRISVKSTPGKGTTVTIT